MSVLQAKFVKCPFYHTNTSNKIVCEGLSDGNTINLVFQSCVDRNNHMVVACYDIELCRECPIYIMLEKKYNGDE
jgi:hypothetical protein